MNLQIVPRLQNFAVCPLLACRIDLINKQNWIFLIMWMTPKDLSFHSKTYLVSFSPPSLFCPMFSSPGYFHPTLTICMREATFRKILLVLSWFIEWMINWWINLTFKDMFQFIIGPESDHWLCLSLTNWLTNSLTDCCLVNLMPVNIAVLTRVRSLAIFIGPESDHCLLLSLTD